MWRCHGNIFSMSETLLTFLLYFKSTHYGVHLFMTFVILHCLLVSFDV